LGDRPDQFAVPHLQNVQAKEILTSTTDKIFALKDLALIALVLLGITLIAFFTVAK
jgi:hypothetical protein